MLSGGRGSMTPTRNRPSPNPAAPLVAMATLNRPDGRGRSAGDQELVQGHRPDLEGGSDSSLTPPPPSPGTPPSQAHPPVPRLASFLPSAQANSSMSWT